MADSPYGPDQGPGYEGYEYPPPRKGMSTGAKVAIGCGVALLVAIVAAAIFVFFAGRFVSEQIGGFGAQKEASETFERLAAEYPFEPPADGVVSDRQARTFFDVTDEVWPSVADYADELNRVIRQAEESEDETELRDVMSGMEAMGKLLRARLVLAETLESYQLSNHEYVWTGSTLMQAYGVLTGAETEADEPVPSENLELAGRYQTQLAELAWEEEDRIGKGILLLISLIDSGEKEWSEVFQEE